MEGSLSRHNSSLCNPEVHSHRHHSHRLPGCHRQGEGVREGGLDSQDQDAQDQVEAASFQVEEALCQAEAASCQVEAVSCQVGVYILRTTGKAWGQRDPQGIS